MTTITQRRKGWWKIWAVIFAIVIIVVIAVILSYIPNEYGEPILDLTPVQDTYLSAFMWGSATIVNAILLTVAFIFFGILLCWIYYAYIGGQKVKTNTMNPAAPYMGQSGLSQQPQQETETVVSS